MRHARSILVLSLLAGLGVLLSAPVAAHDFWIEPSSYRPAPHQRVLLRLRVGASFLGDPVPRDEDLLVRFVTIAGGEEQRVPGVHGVDPAGIAQAPESGTLVVAYESRGSLVELTPDKLALYAEQEGVGAQLPARWQRKASMRDRFARSVKSLLVVQGTSGDTQDGGWERVVGLPLELVPGLAGLGAGGSLPLQLLWHGKPAADIQVTALSRLDPAKPVSARTDAAGRVTLALPRGGEWLVKAVKIVPTADDGSDFQSVWTSLTFQAAAP